LKKERIFERQEAPMPMLLAAGGGAAYFTAGFADGTFG
jgi:hypothetical protein